MSYARPVEYWEVRNEVGPAKTWRPGLCVDALDTQDRQRFGNMKAYLDHIPLAGMIQTHAIARPTTEQTSV